MRAVSILILAAAVSGTPRLNAQTESEEEARAKPAEESRLDARVFREALKQRGLTELLELHLRDFPPPGRTARRLIQRQMKLAVFADKNLPREKRVAAIAEANRILAALIGDMPDDPRHFDWRFSLAHSLIYDEAEPMFTSILYRGAGDGRSDDLISLTTRAIAVLKTLQRELSAEYERIEDLSVQKFEQLERTGYVERIDVLGPKTEYLLAWARFFDALARNASDPARARRLNLVSEYIAGNPPLTETPHKVSHIQIQALVLNGMTARRLNDHILARSCFARALRVADGLSDSDERARVAWAVTLARMEQVRNDYGDGRFEEAMDSLARFRAGIAKERKDNFGLRIVAALLERSVLRARADRAAQQGRRAEAMRARAQAWTPLERLAVSNPDRRDEIYATLYRAIGPEADVAGLDPFEQCALIAGLLFNATDSADGTNPLLERAVSVGEHFMEKSAAEAPSLVPEVLYNTAVAQYRRGRLADAVKRFVDVARDHGEFTGAEQAAAYAVQLAADLYADESLADDPRIRELYLGALQLVVTDYARSEAGRYWRFYYAQLLSELKRYDEAAKQYSLVQPDHEHYSESEFLHLKCLSLALRSRAATDAEPVVNLRRRADEFIHAQRRFVTRITAELARDGGARASALRDRLARARLMGAEIMLLPLISRPAQALEILAEFGDGVPEEQAELAGRLWRVRLLAYEQLGRAEEAARAIPAFVRADPIFAGQTLQTLYSGLSAEAKELREAGDDRAAEPKAELALVLAEQLMAWSRRNSEPASPSERRMLAVQLAEANLEAGRYDRAREQFEPLVSDDSGDSLPRDPLELRALFGYAETLYQTGERPTALVLFNRLATGLRPDEPMRWKSLLRDLQCRTGLKHDPRSIIRVIKQQRFLFPGLGGASLAAEFDRLQRENQRRADTG